MESSNEKMTVEHAPISPDRENSVNDKKKNKRQNVFGKKKRVPRKMLWSIKQIITFILAREKMMLQKYQNHDWNNISERIERRMDELEEYVQTELRSLPVQGHQMFEFIEVPINTSEMTACFNIWKKTFFAEWRELCNQFKKEMMEEYKKLDEFKEKTSHDITAMQNTIQELQKTVLDLQNSIKSNDCQKQENATIAQTTVNVLRLETITPESTTESPTYEVIPTEIIPVSIATLAEFEENMREVRRDILDSEKRMMNEFREFKAENFLESCKVNNISATSTLNRKRSHSVEEPEQVESKKYATNLELQHAVNHFAIQIASAQADQEMKLKDIATKSNLAEMQTTLEMSLKKYSNENLKKSQDKMQRRIRENENQILQLEIGIRRNFPNWNLQTTVLGMMALINRPNVVNHPAQFGLPIFPPPNLPGTSSQPSQQMLSQTPGQNTSPDMNEDRLDDNIVLDSE